MEKYRFELLEKCIVQTYLMQAHVNYEVQLFLQFSCNISGNPLFSDAVVFCNDSWHTVGSLF